MRRTVFYSWQSDLPNATNRGFIQRALEEAAKAIAEDDSIAVEPVVDRDTQGVAGSPDIASTIFGKIATADVVVADVSIIGRSAERATPNPNVLIELGYALRALGHERVILVFNDAFGRTDELPFDLRMRRVVPYSMAQEAASRSAERTSLTRALDAALRAALAHAPPPLPAVAPAVAAIENAQGNRVLVLRRNLEDVWKHLVALEPKRASADGTIEAFLAGVDATQDAMAEFSAMCESIAGMNDLEAALEAYHWIGRLVGRYDILPDHKGVFSNADFDYFKFLGHEAFVTLIAKLLHEQRWVIIERLLDEPIPVDYLRRENGPGLVFWDEVSEHLVWLIDESERRGRMSLHTDLLHERHASGRLAAAMPYPAFAAADLLLYLRGGLAQDAFSSWRPWSVFYLERCPMFIRLAERRETAEQLARVLKVTSVEELAKRMPEKLSQLSRLFPRGHWRWPFRKEDFESIGAR